MEPSSIDKILEARKQAEPPPTPPADVAAEDKFFSILVGEGLVEHFFEIQYQDGARTCFSYSDLLWFLYDPDDHCIDLDFGGIQVIIVGRGLSPKLFNGIKSKRVAWVREADSEMEDHKDNETYIEQIVVVIDKPEEKKQAKSEPEQP